MKIAATDLALQADQTLLKRQESRETLRAWRGERPDFESLPAALSTALPSVVTDLSAAARRLSAALPAPAAMAPQAPTAPTVANSAVNSAAAIETADSSDSDPVLSLVKQMIEMLTGKEVRVFDMQAFSADLRHVEARSSAATASVQQAATGRAGYGVEYDYQAVREEFEQTRFSATGVVRTADGQELSFSLDLEMTRYYREESRVSLRAGDAVRKDPLVINFGGTAAQLAAAPERRFRFDLDGDGRLESLPLFASGSGFLALDRNGNGIIDAAEELFGPASGNGFADLAALDGDGNGWIDEADAAFDTLRVWTPQAGDRVGAGALSSLADLGIGALGLQHVASPFALRGPANEDLGMVRAGGLYLNEDGRAGSLQEVDLTV